MDTPKLEGLTLDGIGYSVEYHTPEDAHGICLTVVWEDFGYGIYEPALALAFPKRYATESEIQHGLLEYHELRPQFAHKTKHGRRGLARFGD